VPLPGFGQIYNKQYWKLSILYPLVGGSIGMFAYENGKYKPLRRQYDQMLIDNGYGRTPQLDALQTDMIRHNTRRQIYAGIALATYIYFIGDAAINYSTNDVSDIKKATTLSTICPGAGQIYNKSYWRVPIVVGALASTIYTIDWNNRGYKRFKKAYSLRVDYQNNPDKYPNGSPDEFHGNYSASPQPRPLHTAHGRRICVADRRRACRRTPQRLRHIGRSVDEHNTLFRLHDDSFGRHTSHGRIQCQSHVLKTTPNHDRTANSPHTARPAAYGRDNAWACDGGRRRQTPQKGNYPLPRSRGQRNRRPSPSRNSRPNLCRRPNPSPCAWHARRAR